MPIRESNTIYFMKLFNNWRSMMDACRFSRSPNGFHSNRVYLSAFLLTNHKLFSPLIICMDLHLCDWRHWRVVTQRGEGFVRDALCLVMRPPLTRRPAKHARWFPCQRFVGNHGAKSFFFFFFLKNKRKKKFHLMYWAAAVWEPVLADSPPLSIRWIQRWWAHYHDVAH